MRTLSFSVLVLVLLGCTVGSNGPADAGVSADAGNEPVRLVVEPSEVSLESVDGSLPLALFRAIALTFEGERSEVAAEWSVTSSELGTVDDEGTFTATGRAGGTVEVHASIPGPAGALVARATVIVRVTHTVAPDPSVPPTVIDDFDTLPVEEDPYVAPAIAYPLDGARMPNNVAPPDVQWHPVGGEGDSYRITLSTDHTTVRAYVHDDGDQFGSHYEVDPAAFRLLADSARGREVTVRVDRLPAAREKVIPGFPITLWLSEDGVFGTVYYWQVRAFPESSDVFRVEASTGERTNVFGASSGTCVGCHALSHDGRNLAATRGGTATWRTSVVDAASETAPPPDLLTPIEPALNFLAWSPAGDRILASRAAGTDRSDTRLVLLDAEDGSDVAATGLPTEIAGYPTWSPNGSLVAWMQGGGDGPEGTADRTRIVVADVDGDTFSPRVLHDGGDLALSPEGGTTDSRPTFSPDSRFVAFAHGSRSVSSVGRAAEGARAGLYLVPSGGGEPVRLERGMGRYGPVDAFWPVFSPFVTEEEDGTVHYWLAFYSRQDYGNELAGTRGTGRRQLWVMALDPALAAAGEDPSHPPYWVPGQDAANHNIAALWAPTACFGRGESCGASSECCSGECGPNPSSELGELICQPPTVCRRYGESCETADDCCDGLGCNLGICGYEAPN